MTDDPPGDEPDRPIDEPGDDRSDDGRDRAGPDDDRPRDGRWSDAGAEAGDSGWLSELLTALDRFGELSSSDRRRSGRSIVDYSIDVRSGIDDVAGDRGSNRGDRRGRSTLGERPRGRTRRKRSGSNRHHVTTRTREDELLVTADVAGADPDDVTVGFDDGTLVVGVDDSELERVAVPWDDPAADAVVRNGVLTVTVEPGEGASNGVGAEPGGEPDE